MIDRQRARGDGLSSCYRGVVLGTFSNPTAEQLDLLRGKSITPQGHSRLELPLQVQQDDTLLRLAGKERRSLASSGLEFFVGSQE